MRNALVGTLLCVLPLVAHGQDNWLTYDHPNPPFSIEYPRGWQVRTATRLSNLDMGEMQMPCRADVHFDTQVNGQRLRIGLRLYEMSVYVSADRLAEALNESAGGIEVGDVRGRTYGRYEVIDLARTTIVTVVTDPADPPYVALVTLRAPIELRAACLGGYERMVTSLAFPSEAAKEEPIPALSFGAPEPVDAPGPVSWARWSPDGARIAAVCSVEGVPQVWVLSPEGDEPMRLAGELASAQEPAWAPDGTVIALAGAPHSGEMNIYLAPVGGAEVTRLTETRTDREGKAIPGAEHRLPRWSPDGSRILYNGVLRGHESGSSYLTSLEPGEEDTPQRLLSSTDVSWAPDGRRAVCSLAGKIWVVNVTGGPSAPITGPCDGREPVWSPDGRRIAFVRGPEPDAAGNAPEQSLVIVYPDGSDPRPRARLAAIADPAWSPDSKHIAFTDGAEKRACVVAINGADLAPVADSLPGSFRPRWSPDGKWILLIAGDDEDGAGTLYRVPVTSKE